MALLARSGTRYSGIGLVPYGPHMNTSHVQLADASLITMTAIDFNGRDPSILRTVDNGQRLLRTPVNDRSWLNGDAEFVTSFTHGHWVYAVVRESPLEREACEVHGARSAKVSRLVRLCANDNGGDVDYLASAWSTLAKATIECDGLTSVTDMSMNDDGKTIVATFASQK